MTKSRGRWLGLLGVAAAIAAAAGYRFTRPAPVNVLLITLDTTRADHIGCYGYAAAKTPALDGLAQRGVMFERAITVAPLTLPAHATLMTGLYPPEHGLRLNGCGALDPNFETLAEILKSRRYRTGAFVGSFVLDHRFGLNSGFDVYDDDMRGGDYSADPLHRRRSGATVVQAALDWLNRTAAEPFFCWVHLFDPHAPYAAREQEFGSQFAEHPYDAGIAFADAQVAKLLTWLRDRKLDRNTLIVVVGDHGEGLGDHVEREHGNRLYESTLHVPLWIVTPERPAAGRRVTKPVSLVDVMPTVLDGLGVPVPTEISGRSMKPALGGVDWDPSDCYSETDFPLAVHGWAPQRSLTTTKWKYIRTTRCELYDLAADPFELHNLAEELPDEAARLDQSLANLESGMRHAEYQTLNLSDRERKKLESLGYLSSGTKPVINNGQPLPDMKDMQPHLERMVDAREALERGDATEAERLFAEVVEAIPDHALARLFWGESLLQLDRTDEAITAIEDVLRREPGLADARLQLGLAYAAQKKWREAAEEFQHAIAAAPQSAECHFRLAIAWLHLGRRDAARNELQACLAIDPGYVAARLELATLLARSGDPAAGIRECETALAYRRDWPEAHNTLALIYAGQRRLDDAVNHARTAARLDPDNAEWRYNLGIFHAMQGRVADARTELSAALRLDPDHPHAREQLEKLERGP